MRDFSGVQIAVALLGIGLLVAGHELGHFVAARLCGMRVLRFSLGFGPRLVSFVRGGVRYQIAAFPFGGFVQIAGMTPMEPGALADPHAFIQKPRWARALVLLAGPAMNYLIAFLLFLVFYLVWPGGVGTVQSVVPGSPAAAAGVQPGDLIVQVGRKNLRSASDLTEGVQGLRRVELRLYRPEAGGEPMRVAIDAPAPLSDLVDLGLTLHFRQLGREYGASVIRSLGDCWRHSWVNLHALWRLAAGDPEVSASGPIGIVRELKDQAKRSTPNFLWLLGVLSVSLGLLNLLPIPALDGIKVLFLGVEGALRRNLSPVFQLGLNAVGLVLFLVLMVVLSIGDLRAALA